MTDPSDGMKSFQQELRRGGIAIHIAKPTRTFLFIVMLRMDHPNIGFTYVRLKGKTATAMRSS